MSQAENIIPIHNAKALGFNEERLKHIESFLQKNYIDKKKLGAYSVLLSRKGEVAHFSCGGTLAVGNPAPVSADSIFRIYSMTKPITSVALMMLFEQGRFQLSHPVAKYLPEFRDVQVWDGGNNLAAITRPAASPMTIHHLLTHCSGLTYSFAQAHPVDRLYRDHKIDGGLKIDGGGTNEAGAMNLEQTVKAAAQLPLMFDPGTQWNYSISTDVCGRLVEVISGMSLDEFFQKNIFEPLQMNDTSFHVPPEKLNRFLANYTLNPETGDLFAIDPNDKTSPYTEKPVYLSGGAGLVSTIGDYHRFCQMCLNQGELDGARLLSPNTLRFMTDNHLPNRANITDISVSAIPVVNTAGTGFGLGFAVITDPAAYQQPLSKGSYFWGGAAGTLFWIDPAEELVVIFMTQIMPADLYPVASELQQMTYAALV